MYKLLLKLKNQRLIYDKTQLLIDFFVIYFFSYAYNILKPEI